MKQPVLVQLWRREFTGYTGARFRSDLIAGLTVAAVALPLALAFGVASSATAAAGLVTAIIAGFVIGALYVPAKLAWQGRLLSTVTGSLRALLNPLRRADARTEIPEALRMRVRLGPAICAGVIAAITLAQIGA